MTTPPATLEPTLDEQIEWMRMEAQYYKGSPRPAILASLERLKALDEQQAAKAANAKRKLTKATAANHGIKS